MNDLAQANLDTTNQLHELEAQLAESRDAAEKLATLLSTQASESETLRQDLKQLTADLEQVESDKKTMEQAAEEADALLQQESDASQKLRSDLAALQAELQQAHDAHALEKAEMETRIREDLDATISQYASEIARLRQTVASAQEDIAELAQLRAYNKAQRAAADEHEEVVRELQDKIEKLQAQVVAARRETRMMDGKMKSVQMQFEMMSMGEDSEVRPRSS
jgi:chromosome segregation ATPase